MDKQFETDNKKKEVTSVAAPTPAEITQQ